MNLAQAIGYYTFEGIAVLILLVVGSFVAVMAIGALMDRYQRFFVAVDDVEIDGARARIAQAHLAGRSGHI